MVRIEFAKITLETREKNSLLPMSNCVNLMIKQGIFSGKGLVYSLKMNRPVSLLFHYSLNLK